MTVGFGCQGDRNTSGDHDAALDHTIRNRCANRLRLSTSETKCQNLKLIAITDVGVSRKVREQFGSVGRMGGVVFPWLYKNYRTFGLFWE